MDSPARVRIPESPPFVYNSLKSFIKSVLPLKKEEIWRIIRTGVLARLESEVLVKISLIRLQCSPPICSVSLTGGHLLDVQNEKVRFLYGVPDGYEV